MTQDQLTTISALLAKAPDWIRHDLASANQGLRSRAEDALAAMIMAALGRTEQDGDVRGVAPCEDRPAI